MIGTRKLSTRVIPFVLLAISVLSAGCSQSSPNAGKDLDEQMLLILIQPGPVIAGGINFGNKPLPMTLTLEDAEAIARDCPAVVAAAPVVRARRRFTHADKEWTPLYTYGTTPQYLDVRHWPLEQGKMWTDLDTERGAEVCVLGQTVARELWGEGPALGKVVHLNDRSLKVIGILTPRGLNAMGLDRDDIALAPWTTIKYKIAAKVEAAQPAGPIAGRATHVDSVWARVDNPDAISDAVGQITDLLRRRHQIPAGQPDDFNIRDMSEMIKALNSTSKAVTDTLALLRVMVAVGVVVLLAAVTAAYLVFRHGRRKRAVGNTQ